MRGCVKLTMIENSREQRIYVDVDAYTQGVLASKYVAVVQYVTPMDESSEKQDMLCSAFTTDARKSNKQVTNLKQWHQTLKFDHERTLITNSLLTFHERTTFSNHELFAHLFLLTNLTGSHFDCFIPCSSSHFFNIYIHKEKESGERKTKEIKETKK